MLSKRDSFPLASIRCSPISKGSGSTPKNTPEIINSSAGCLQMLWELPVCLTFKHVRVVDTFSQVYQDVQQPRLVALLILKCL